MPGAAGWPALADLLASQSAAPPRTGSLILTFYGDAIAPRGGEVALPALLLLMRQIGFGDGVVRTAVSRLSADGWLDRIRVGRTSFYRLGSRGAQEFADAGHRIFGPLSVPWNGQLRIVVADAKTDRGRLGSAGYALIAPGVLIAPDSAEVPGDAIHLSANGDPGALRALASNAWPLAALGAFYAGFLKRFCPLTHTASKLPSPDAMAARVLLIHEYRRIMLRDPHLPMAMLPEGWPGVPARRLCAKLYSALAPASERWLDELKNTSGPLPRGPDPRSRFSDGDR